MNKYRWEKNRWVDGKKPTLYLYTQFVHFMPKVIFIWKQKHVYNQVHLNNYNNLTQIKVKK